VNLNENYNKYLLEYKTLLNDYPNTNNWEINHRKKILREWILNEQNK